MIIETRCLAGSVVFIDGSHVIRPYGDVTHMLLFVLPRLPVGVVVHIHDIFLPEVRCYLPAAVSLWFVVAVCRIISLSFHGCCCC